MSLAKIGKSYKKLTEANRIAGIKRRGVKMSEKQKYKISNTLKGRVFSEDHKNKLSDIQRGKKHPVKNVTCPYCNKTGNPGGMSNWHFDKCKFKKD